MALLTCPECRKKVSDTAAACPNCGFQLTPAKVSALRRKEQQAQKTAGIGYLVVIAILVIAYMIGSSSPDGGGGGGSSSSGTGTRRSTSSVAGERTITGESYVGCISRDDQDKLTNYAVQEDLDAFRRFLAAGLLTGRCTQFKKGETVYVMDTAIFSGLVKVRRQGEIVDYWTNVEAVQ